MTFIIQKSLFVYSQSPCRVSNEGPYDQMRNIAFSVSSVMKDISQLEHEVYQAAQGNELMFDMVERKHQKELVNHFHMTRHHR